jgi:hypothetical protein
MYEDKNGVVLVVLRCQTDQDMCQVLICPIHDLLNDRLRKNLAIMNQYSLMFLNNEDCCNALLILCMNNRSPHQLDN